MNRTVVSKVVAQIRNKYFRVLIISNNHTQFMVISQSKANLKRQIICKEQQKKNAHIPIRTRAKSTRTSNRDKRNGIQLEWLAIWKTQIKSPFPMHTIQFAMHK